MDASMSGCIGPSMHDALRREQPRRLDTLLVHAPSAGRRGRYHSGCSDGSSHASSSPTRALRLLPAK